MRLAPFPSETSIYASRELSLMDSMAEHALDSAKNSLVSALSALERAAWNTSAIDCTDASNQIKDVLQEIEGLKTQFLESL